MRCQRVLGGRYGRLGRGVGLIILIALVVRLILSVVDLSEVRRGVSF